MLVLQILKRSAPDWLRKQSLKQGERHGSWNLPIVMQNLAIRSAVVRVVGHVFLQVHSIQYQYVI